ncbi:unnamed protein product [Amoebophrya sp. A25]|nr:unnamed protein product [Amoebophrya sp. A25]|eukprot:GSA25T00004710001.1
MISVARNRLNQELRELKKDKDPDISLRPDENTSEIWHGHVIGPKETPFADGRFRLRIQIPPSYPLAAPKIWFKTKIFHPNVHFDSGELCLDILKTDWSPVWSLRTVMRAIIALLAEPNADSPLNCDAGNLLRANDVLGFNTLARMYTVEHAINGVGNEEDEDGEGGE